MRTIKFRGREKTKAGNLIYGNYARYQYTDDGVEGDFITNIRGEGLLVHSDSVAQLVGVDRNGNEVYEGDVVTNPRDGTTFKAAMNHIYTVKSYTLKD